MLSRAWFFLSGMAFAFSVVMASMSGWFEMVFFVAFSAFAASVPLKGWFWTREEQLENATRQFRNARLRLVRGEGEE